MQNTIQKYNLPYGRQTIDKEDIQEVTRTLSSDFLTCGPKVREFEEKFATYVGSKYAVAVSSGTAALHLACIAAGLKHDDEMITSPITFVASANCALYCNAKPVFADITEQGLIDENDIEKKITTKTKVIIPVHYAGLPCNLEAISHIAKKNRVTIIEDACHALGAKYKNTKIGDCSYSSMVCFSFHPVKHITTGEGGMITTNSTELYQKLLMLRHHGISKDHFSFNIQNQEPWYHEMQHLGFNYRITDFQCALGISQLKKVDQFVNKRRSLAKNYELLFRKLKENKQISMLGEQEEQYHAYHLYVILLKNADLRLKVFKMLNDNVIHCQVHYIPVYWHPYYQKLGYSKGLCPKAEEFYSRIISLPLYPSLTEEEQTKIIDKIEEVLA